MLSRSEPTAAVSREGMGVALVIAIALLATVGFALAPALGQATTGAAVSGPAGPLPLPSGPGDSGGPAAPPPLSRGTPAVPVAPSGVVSTTTTTNPLGPEVLPGTTVQLPVIHASNVPQSWAGLRLPGGGYQPPGILPAAVPAGAGWSGSGGSYASNGSGVHCVGFGPSPSTNAQYPADCIGHDEPSIDFYSNLPGSGGNISWNVTLPVSRNASAEQADLYIAIWFGMTLNDPDAWEQACFLELQFYPDSTWANTALDLNGTATNNWIAAAFAWQLVLGSGAGNLLENPCFLQPLYANGATSGNSFFNMHGGDHLSLVFNGWPGDPTGETIAVTDLTQHTATSMTLYNGTCANYQEWFGFAACGGNYPLDPAYVSNSYQGSMPWSPTTVYPAAFAFEVGHSGSPQYPNLGLFGGCYPGWTHVYGTTYCPTYNPSSWLNDTAQPWEIGLPTFYNSATSEQPAQVAFNQDLGGEAFSNGTAWSNFAYSYDYGLPSFGCSPSTYTGSEHCSYPWYSYYCSIHAFEFGATDYPGVSDDFGKWQQYTRSWTTGPEAGIQGGLMPTNFSIPTCGGPSYSLTVGSQNPTNGSVYFLSTDYAAPTTVDGLGAGTYAVHALPAAGQSFQGWVTAGGVSVSQPRSPWTTVDLSGSGTLTATFSAAAPTPVTVYFNDSMAGGEISLTPGFTEAFQPQIGDLANGTAELLAPGTYSIQAIPPAGSATAGAIFSHFTISVGGNVSTPYWPFAWLTIDGTTRVVQIEAYYTSSALTVVPLVEVVGDVTAATLNGVPLTALSPTAPTVYANGAGLADAPATGVGGYTLSITPATGWVVVASEFIGAMSIDTHTNSMAMYVQPTPSTANQPIIEVIMAAEVTLTDSAANGGNISLGYGPFNHLLSALGLYPPTLLPSGPLPSGTVVDLVPSTFSCTICTPRNPALAGPYSIYAVPSPATAFTGWSVNTGANITPASSSAMYTTAQIDNTGTLTASYTPSASYNVQFLSYPANGGETEFNFQTVPSGAPGINATAGTYLMQGLPAPGYKWIGFEPWGDVNVAASCHDSSICNLLTVSGSGFVYSLFQPLTDRVTFVTNLPGWVSATLNGTPVSNGGTVGLSPGSYPASLMVPSGVTAAVLWTGSAGLVPSDPSTPATTLQVTGPGTIYALVGAATATPTLSASVIDVGASVTLRVAAIGFGTLSYSWNGLPSGCSSVNAPVLSCSPSSSGTSSITVTVSSSAGPVVTSDPVSLVVGGALNAVARLSAPTVDVGVPLIISLVVSGGAAPYTFNDSAAPAGCASGSAGAKLVCVEASPGSYSGALGVADAAGVSRSVSVTFTVNPLPQVSSFNASATSLETGQNTTLSVTVAGGTGPFTYSYTGLPGGCISSNAPTLLCRPSAGGTFTVIVMVRDANNKTAQSALVLTVTSPPSPPSPTASQVGTSPAVVAALGLGAAGAALGVGSLVSRRRARRVQ